MERARRIWNTHIHATVKTIDNAISRYCKVGGLKIKRKTRTNPSTGKLTWWFVVHDEEAVLCELEHKWENLHVQTSWELEQCTKPSESTIIDDHPEPVNQENAPTSPTDDKLESNAASQELLHANTDSEALQTNSDRVSEVASPLTTHDTSN